MHDVAFACAGYADKQRWPLYEKVRSAAYEALLLRPKNEIFVMTNALSNESEREIEAWKHVVELAISRGVPLIPIILTADANEISNRICSLNRLSTKLKDPEALIQMISEYSLQIPVADETIVFDVGTLSSEEAASLVVHHIQEHMGSFSVATTAHLALA